MGVFMKTMAMSFEGDGGIFMWSIFVPLVVAMILIAERVYALYIKAGFSGKGTIGTVVDFLRNGDESGAQDYVAKNTTPLGKIMNVILANKSEGEEVINKRVEEVFLVESPKIQRFLPLINAMANVATLLGLLGTIIGLILAFDAVANVPAAQRAQALATGISVAMATTAFGLVVAIPTLFIHGILTAQSEKVLEQMDEVSAKLTNIVLLDKE